MATPIPLVGQPQQPTFPQVGLNILPQGAGDHDPARSYNYHSAAYRC